MSLIESSDYDLIRESIDESRNENNLPPGRIERRIPEAEEWVAARVDDLDEIAESVAEADVSRYAHAKRAACFYVAALIAPTCNIPTSDAVGGIGASYSRQVESPSARRARLMADAERELDAATAAVEVGVRVGGTGSAQTVARW